MVGSPYKPFTRAINIHKYPGIEAFNYCHQKNDDITLHANTPIPLIRSRKKAARSVGGFRTKKSVPVGSNQRIGWPEADIKNVPIANVPP